MAYQSKYSGAEIEEKLDKVDNLVTSVNNKTGVVTLTKADLGLGNVDNTSDADKSVYEDNIKWGINHKPDNTCSPIDACLIPELGANRFAFIAPKKITIEYSRDNGETWEDYDATDEKKINLMNGVGSNFYIGKNDDTSAEITNFLLRVNIDTFGAKCYMVLKKIAIYMASNGAINSYCTIEGRTRQNDVDNVDTWHTFVDKVTIGGWPGYNIINNLYITTYGNTPATQYGTIRFTFGCGGRSTKYPTGLGLCISRILGFSSASYSQPSNLATNSHLYKWDYQQNAIFPAGVTATAFNGNASSATKAMQDGDGETISTTYAKKSEVVTKEDGKQLSSNDYTTEEKNKLSAISEYTIGEGLTVENGVLKCSFVPTRYYTGSSEPIDTQGNNGDLYLQIK